MNLIRIIDEHFRMEYYVDGENLIEVTQVFDEILSEIEYYYPDFFSWFETQIRTGNHATIEAAMLEAASITEEVVRLMPEFTEIIDYWDQNKQKLEENAEAIGPDGPRTLAETDDFIAALSSGGPGLGAYGGEPSFATDIAIFIVLAAAFAVPPVLAVAFAVAVAAAWYWTRSPEEPSYWIGDQFVQEEIIASLAIVYDEG